MSDIQIKGLAELQRALDQLPAQIEANIMRGGLRAGAKVLAKAAQANAAALPGAGALAESVRFGAKLDKRAGKLQAYARAGGKSKKGSGKANVFYAHMVEYGTAAHIITARPPNKLLAIGVPSVNHPGAKKHPFMRPALDQHQAAALDATAAYIRNRLATKHGLTVPAPVDPEAEPDE